MSRKAKIITAVVGAVIAVGAGTGLYLHKIGRASCRERV